ncbi:hypothetical protein ADJ76_04410 [Schaalia meyeri]|nr:hypothetical protein ADJ76_04410 [Schaalia meyeri]OFQ21658.1 hypothetical protein HMPREF2946_01360 [Actinomyces sp. HMSC062G12]
MLIDEGVQLSSQLTEFSVEVVNIPLFWSLNALRVLLKFSLKVPVSFCEAFLYKNNQWAIRIF